MNLIHVDLGEIKNTCFVVMPYSTIYQSEWESIIKPALLDLDITPVRGDEIYGKQRIMDDIWQSIRNARFVLAELTGRNPNVLYEVGLAHAIGKPVIIITRNAEDVPFDLKDLRYIYYDVNDPFWGENLKTAIQVQVQKLIDNPDLENYLAGISKPTPLVYPKIKQIKKNKANPNLPDLTGEWIGSFDLGGYHGVEIKIEQDGNNLNAIATIRIPQGDSEDVVQEIMAGTIEESKAVLKGVNYSFDKRDVLDDYMLDSFVFDKFENNLIMGKIFDDEDEKQYGIIKLARR